MPALDAQTYGFGKMIRDFHASLIRAVLKKYAFASSVQNNLTAMQGLGAFRERLNSGASSLRGYYDAEVARVL
jgi:hypothetical protein